MPRFIYLFIGLLVLSACEKENPVELKKAYTQEEFEEACHDLLYSTFEEYNQAGIQRDFSNIREFFQKDNLPEGIVDSINTYVMEDYLTYHTNGYNDYLPVNIESIVNKNMWEEYKLTVQPRTKNGITVTADNIILNLYNHARWEVSSIAMSLYRECMYQIEYPIEYRGIVECLINNTRLSSDQISNYMRETTFDSNSIYQNLMYIVDKIKTEYKKPRNGIICAMEHFSNIYKAGNYGTSGSSSGGNPSPLPEILPSPEFLANEKLNCIWEILNSGNTSFQRYLTQFDNDFSIVDLEFDISNSLPSNVNGRTDNSNENKILISINGNTLGNRPALGVARTIIHEAIHAELYRKVRSVNNQISINDFPGIYDYYRRYIKNWQHQQMAAHYIDLMGKMLKEFDGGRMSDQYYRDISWNGLYMVGDKNNPGNYIYTVAFDDLTSAEKTRILNNIKNLKENGTKGCD